MSYLEELLPKFRKGAKIRCNYWDKKQYIQLKEDGYIYDDKDDRIEFSALILFGKSWEFYKEPDWDFIIKNKCLCWFWDDNEKSKTLKFLTNVHAEDEYRFNGFWPVHGNCTYKHCRPVRRYEVTFYEDRNDNR